MLKGITQVTLILEKKIFNTLYAGESAGQAAGISQLAIL